MVNTSSVGGLIAFPEASPYIASKHAVMGLTRSAALDYAKRGNRVNAVSPGFIDTEMNDRTLELLGITVDALVSRSPMARVGEAAEIAQFLQNGSRTGV
ncbi:SDR family oxidoreductase [Nostoc sp. FACHB-892]|uniref:SDR family oxidoreductase n=1 Tax=Nostoc sp. FACHB-892 TaxID=2692843 RepID=UPI00168291C9|nr:SDR family oxidoreductase [Nostoc sp. FACHB-892]MBW4454767.1 SDR family oxidoreductase [Nostoc indistinguendum CM1-VF10]